MNYAKLICVQKWSNNKEQGVTNTNEAIRILKIWSYQHRMFNLSLDKYERRSLKNDEDQSTMEIEIDNLILALYSNVEKRLRLVSSSLSILLEIALVRIFLNRAIINLTNMVLTYLSITLIKPSIISKYFIYCVFHF